MKKLPERINHITVSNINQKSVHRINQYNLNFDAIMYRIYQEIAKTNKACKFMTGQKFCFLLEEMRMEMNFKFS